ncbi:hypothetical protein ACFVT1_13575 [Streptomyces sp. NPDC057963]|uniref:hypothetical protein n=1 Tax=Streptomyces sp. NPDC057963 TaxID=3346290 RepID=UPI0036E391DF
MHKPVRHAWDTGRNVDADHIRGRLERALLLLEVDGMLYVRSGKARDNGWLAENVGEDLAAPFSLCLKHSIRITLLPARP